MIPINFYIDLAKAFDSVNHDILLQKTVLLQRKWHCQNTPKELLSDKKQYVKIDEVKSSIQSIKTGVPQGSIVGPFVI